MPSADVELSELKPCTCLQGGFTSLDGAKHNRYSHLCRVAISSLTILVLTALMELDTSYKSISVNYLMRAA